MGEGVKEEHSQNNINASDIKDNTQVNTPSKTNTQNNQNSDFQFDTTSRGETGTPNLSTYNNLR